jgi:hypothetical protein
LIKLDAPQEYSGLGSLISQKRKTDAEDGRLHQTARKLGALFDAVVPRAPALFKAYGIRATEISSIPSVNPKPSSRDGVFANHIGADVSSIWAAVTSGGTAIAVHLLACMLARIFSSPEATYIWVELVLKRKAEIVEASQDAMYPSDHHVELLAAKQDISRADLASWDASARAWIQSADQAKSSQHKQLMVVLHEAGIPVNNESGTFKSVDIVRSQIPHMFTGTLYHPPSALWTNILLAAIDRLEDYDEVEKRLARQLIALGRRRPMFIYSNTDANPLFGLSRLSTLLPLMKSVNSRIQLLRNLAHQWGLSNEHYIIRYRPDGGFDNLDTVFEYAAVSPVVIDQGKRANDGSSKISPIYRRWISVGQHELQDFDLSPIRLHSRFACQVPDCKGSTNVFCRNAEHSLIWQRAQMFLRLGEQCFPALDYQPGGTLGTSLYFINGLDFMMAIDSARDTSWKSCFINPGGLITNLTYFAGDPNTAAIFSMKVESSPKVNSFGEIGPHMLEPHQMEGILTPEIINTEALVGKLYNLTAINSEYESLKAFASVSEVYKLLPDAMVSTAVVGIPIYGARWFPRLRDAVTSQSGGARWFPRLRDAVTSQSGGALQPVLRLSRAEVFACISMFDSGSYNLDPDALQEVFAMSSGNSIYITGSMICDPYE